MAIEIEKRELRSYELRKRKHKNVVTIVTIIIIIVVMCLGLFVVSGIINKKYTNYQVIHTKERSDSSSASYQSYGKNILRYSRDGAMAMDGAGNMLWNGTYEFHEPLIDISNNYVAISDRGNKDVMIFDGKGGTSTVSVLHPIIKTEIANQGVIAVLMEGNDVNYIELYSEEGEFLVEVRTTVQKDGCPIDISLSSDGTKLVTSYVTINNGTVQNKVTFYNFGGVGQNYVSRVVGGFDYEQTIIPKVEFLDNNTVCVFGDDKFSIYSMTKIPELVYQDTFTSEIKSIFHSDTYVGFVLKNIEGEDKYQVKLYDLKGKLILDKMTNYEYDNIVVSGDEVILYSDQEWIIWRINGKEKFHYNFDSNISYILPMNNLDKYIIIDNLNVEEVKLIKD